MQLNTGVQLDELIPPAKTFHGLRVGVNGHLFLDTFAPDAIDLIKLPTDVESKTDYKQVFWSAEAASFLFAPNGHLWINT
jgi:hypothetical protein